MLFALCFRSEGTGNYLSFPYNRRYCSLSLVPVPPVSCPNPRHAGQADNSTYMESCFVKNTVQQFPKSKMQTSLYLVAHTMSILFRTDLLTYYNISKYTA